MSADARTGMSRAGSRTVVISFPWFGFIFVQLFFLRDFGACHFPEYHDSDPVQDAHYEEKRRSHGAQQLPDVVVEDRSAHGPEACRDADYAGYVAYGECLGDHHADRVEPAQAHDEIRLNEAMMAATFQYGGRALK